MLVFICIPTVTQYFPNFLVCNKNLTKSIQDVSDHADFKFDVSFQVITLFIHTVT